MNELREAKKLLKEVQEWRDRLFYLGIGHYDVTIHLVEETQSEVSAYATSHINDTYDEVDIEFTHEFLNLDPKRRVEIIIHELLHVFMRDLDRHVESVERWLPEGAYKDYEERLIHEREGVVDRLARTILSVYEDSPTTPIAKVVS